MAVFDQRVTSSFNFSSHGSCANQLAAFSPIMANNSGQQKEGSSNRKRQLDADIMDEMDGPSEKKRFEQFSDEFSSFSLNSPIINEMEDNDAIGVEELPTTSDEMSEDEPEFYVEEPEEGGKLVLYNDLSKFLERMKSEPIVPLRPQNNALVLYNPADSIRSRIVEITDADQSRAESEEQPKAESLELSPTRPMGDQEEEMEID